MEPTTRIGLVLQSYQDCVLPLNHVGSRRRELDPQSSRYERVALPFKLLRRCLRQVSSLRPAALQAATLPSELHRRLYNIKKSSCKQFATGSNIWQIVIITVHHSMGNRLYKVIEKFGCICDKFTLFCLFD